MSSSENWSVGRGRGRGRLSRNKGSPSPCGGRVLLSGSGDGHSLVDKEHLAAGGDMTYTDSNVNTGKIDTEKNDGNESSKRETVITADGRRSLTLRCRGRKKKPEIQVYVPRAKRLQQQHEQDDSAEKDNSDVVTTSSNHLAMSLGQQNTEERLNEGVVSPADRPVSARRKPRPEIQRYVPRGKREIITSVPDSHVRSLSNEMKSDFGIEKTEKLSSKTRPAKKLKTAENSCEFSSTDDLDSDLSKLDSNEDCVSNVNSDHQERPMEVELWSDVQETMAAGPDFNISHDSYNKQFSDSENISHDSFNKQFSDSENISHDSYNKPFSDSENISHDSFNKQFSDSENISHDSYNKPFSDSENISHDSFNKQFSDSENISHDSFNKRFSDSENISHDSYNKPFSDSENNSTFSISHSSKEGSTSERNINDDSPLNKTETSRVLLSSGKTSNNNYNNNVFQQDNLSHAVYTNSGFDLVCDSPGMSEMMPVETPTIISSSFNSADVSHDHLQDSAVSLCTDSISTQSKAEMFSETEHNPDKNSRESCSEESIEHRNNASCNIGEMMPAPNPDICPVEIRKEVECFDIDLNPGDSDQHLSTYTEQSSYTSHAEQHSYTSQVDESSSLDDLCSENISDLKNTSNLSSCVTSMSTEDCHYDRPVTHSDLKNTNFSSCVTSLSTETVPATTEDCHYDRPVTHSDLKNTSNFSSCVTSLSTETVPATTEECHYDRPLTHSSSLPDVVASTMDTSVHRPGVLTSLALRQLETPADHCPLPSDDVDEAEDSEDEDGWETMFDDNGDCLDPSIMEELTSHVGNVQIDKPKINYLKFETKDPELDMEEYNHVIEIFDFPSEFKTPDLISVFKDFMAKGFDIKWVDDTHALGVFANTIAARDALAMVSPFLKVRQLSEASKQSKIKAKKSLEFLQPYKARPQTSAATARRMVSGALGIQASIPREKREQERKLLKEAKEKRKEARQQKKDIWDGSFGKCAMDDT